MSVITCDSCGCRVDTDVDVEAVALWAPYPMCVTCFENLTREDVWNAAIHAAVMEFNRAGCDDADGIRKRISNLTIK